VPGRLPKSASVTRIVGFAVTHWTETRRRFAELSEYTRVLILVTTILVLIVAPFALYAARQIVAGFIAPVAAAAILVPLTIYVARGVRRSRDAKRTEVQRLADQAESDRQARAKARADILQQIADGKTSPILATTDLLLRNSETLWFNCPAHVVQTRNGEATHGSLFLTSLRVVFTSRDAPLEISVPAINSVAHADAYELHIIGKSASSSQTMRVPDAELAATHLRRIVQVYHRQIDVGFEAGDSRNIPQDVRAVVWQRDGGRCVDCGADDYLEYDHLIPHSKGGASTVDNVQLRCRRCNLSKGAKI
jgi:hypothetical protein